LNFQEVDKFLMRADSLREELPPTPYDSGKRLREQGISKAGNRRIRTLAIEISWAWLRYQPRSKLSQWFSERFAGGGPE
jgi:transposase